MAFNPVTYTASDARMARLNSNLLASLGMLQNAQFQKQNQARADKYMNSALATADLARQGMQIQNDLNRAKADEYTGLSKAYNQFAKDYLSWQNTPASLRTAGYNYPTDSSNPYLARVSYERQLQDARQKAQDAQNAMKAQADFAKANLAMQGMQIQNDLNRAKADEYTGLSKAYNQFAKDYLSWQNTPASLRTAGYNYPTDSSNPYLARVSYERQLQDAAQKAQEAQNAMKAQLDLASVGLSNARAQEAMARAQSLSAPKNVNFSTAPDGSVIWTYGNSAGALPAENAQNTPLSNYGKIIADAERLAKAGNEQAASMLRQVVLQAGQASKGGLGDFTTMTLQSKDPQRYNAYIDSVINANNRGVTASPFLAQPPQAQPAPQENGAAETFIDKFKNLF